MHCQSHVAGLKDDPPTHVREVTRQLELRVANDRLAACMIAGAVPGLSLVSQLEGRLCELCAAKNTLAHFSEAGMLSTACSSTMSIAVSF